MGRGKRGKATGQDGDAGDVEPEKTGGFADLFGDDPQTQQIDSKRRAVGLPRSGKRRSPDAAAPKPATTTGENEEPRSFRGEIPPDEFHELRMGRIEPETRIDLHGLDQTQSQHALRKAFGVATASGKRCVVVIHGLGKGSATGEATLKNAVPGWLRSAPLDAWVRGFAPTRPAHGGDGAIYVLLRRSRAAKRGGRS